MRILIVEDDLALGALLEKRMRLEGNDVELVGDGELGVVTALEHQPDLIVLDLSLPRKDGVQVLEELNGKLRDTSILVLTGRNNVQERVRCLGGRLPAEAVQHPRAACALPGTAAAA